MRKKSGRDGSPNRPRAIEVNRRYLRPQSDHFSQHQQAVAKETNFASFSVIPADRNFPDAQSGAVCKKKQLDIESEALDARCLKNRPANIEPKCLEPALGVPKRQSGGDAHEQIENTARLFSPPRLMDSDQAAVQSARAECNVDFAVCDWSDHLRRFAERGRKVCIKKQTDRFSRGKQSGTNSGAFAAIWKILQQACCDLRLRQNLARDRSRCITRSVVHDDQLALGANVAKIIERRAERLADARRFVKARNDNGERRQHRKWLER